MIDRSEKVGGALGMRAAFGVAAIAGLSIAWFTFGSGGGGGQVPLSGGQVGSDGKTGYPSAQGGVQTPNPKKRYAPNVVVVAYHARTPMLARDAKAVRHGLIEDGSIQSAYFHRYFIGPDSVARGATVESTINALMKDPDVRFAEPDFEITRDQTLPNDALFGDLWGLHNVGQAGGTFDADIDAPEAWQTVGTGPNVTVAVCDDGCQWDHPDLAANIWTNTAEVPANGIDDDNNGKIDDIRGWDFSDNDNNPYPAGTDSHGTHTSGTVAAVTNNGIGIAGVARSVKLMPIRIYGGATQWMTALASGIDYAWQNGAKVISVSYNIDGYTQALLEAIQRAGAADVIYVNSAGNNGQQNPPRGAIRDLANNSVFVAATDRNDNLASFSNYGAKIDVAAPGVAVMSTVLTNSYAMYDGTSMACPHMAGACAVIRSHFPSLTARQTLDRLIGTAEMKASLTGKVNGGRINLNNALDTDSTPPSDPANLTLLAYATQSVKIRFEGSGDDGTLGQASSYDIRVSSQPIDSGNFASARQVQTQIPPVNHGVPITTELGGLPPGSVYVAVRAVDNLGNVSGILTGGPYSLRDYHFDRMERASWFAVTSGPWAMTTEQPFHGRYSWSDSPSGTYANSANIAITSRQLPLAGESVMRFVSKYSLESGYDYLYWDVSFDNGVNWTNLGRVDGESGGWKVMTAPIPNGGPNVRIRFRLTSDSSVVRDGVYIDNVSIVPMSTLYVDDMEGSPRYSGDAPWALTTARAYSPVRSWTDSPAGNYANNVNINLTGLDAIDTSSLAGAQLTFRAYISTESGYDFLKVFTSLDGGAYVERGRWSGALAAWNSYSVPVGAGLARVRFNFSSDGSVLGDGVYVDDVRITGEAYTPAP